MFIRGQMFIVTARLFLLGAIAIETTATPLTFETHPPVKFGKAIATPSLFSAPQMYPLPWSRSDSTLRKPNARSFGALAPESDEDAPQPLATFAAVMNGESLPPDVAGAVGTNHLMTTLNGMFQVQAKSGAILSAMTDDAFWFPIRREGYYDPRVIYDRFAARWVVIEAQQDQNGAGLAMAVSRTNDPSAWWSIYFWPLSGSDWYDSPQLAFNSATVMISVLRARPHSSQQSREIFLLNKQALYSENPTATVVTGPPYSNLTPVTALDAGVTANYLLDAVNGSEVRLYEATPQGVEHIATMTAPAPWSDFSVTAPQMGSSERISTNDTRVTSPVLRNHRLWFVQTCFLPADAPVRASLQWWKTTTNGQVLDFGRLDDESGELFRAFPSIAVNRQDDVAIGFSQFSARTFAAAAYAFRSSADAPGVLRAPVVYKPGNGLYTRSINRWGDYSTTITDPDDLTFWTIQESARSPLGSDGRWDTWWAHIPAGQAGCIDGENRLCLAGGRFLASIRWEANGQSGTGRAVRLTADTGYFWFFGTDNIEVIIKVLDACAGYQHFWVFAAGLTNVRLSLDIVDTVTNKAHTYENPGGTAFQPVQDTSTFDVCR